MKAIILAGGKGTRLMPLTKDTPKPMIKIDGKPVLEYQINVLKIGGINEIVICGQYMVEKIKEHFENGKKFGVSIHYPFEKEPLGTGGALKNAEKFIDDDFVLFYGDTFIGMDIRKIIEFHKTKKASITLALHETDHPCDSDLIEIDENNKVINLFKRPNKEPYPSKLAKSSVYVCNKNIIKEIPVGVSNFEQDIVPKFIKDGVVYGYITGEFLKDIGTFERLEKVKKYIEFKKK